MSERQSPVIATIASGVVAGKIAIKDHNNLKAFLSSLFVFERLL